MKNIKYLMAFVLVATLLAVSAFATISVSFDVEEATTDTGVACYKVVVTQSDDEGDWRALQTKVKFNNEKIIPVDWYDGTVPTYTGEAAEYSFKFNSFKNGRTSTGELQRPRYPVWTINGADSEVIVELYWPSLDTYPITASNTMIYEMYFKYADGVTEADLTADDFNVYYMKYANGVDNYYGYSDESRNNIILTNNVVPEAVVLTIPVTVGDKIYLQDGSVKTAATTGDYEVSATVGYVVVNTGKTAQKTYYVDGKTATQVHTNGVVAYEEFHIRGPLELYQGEERKGLRFGKLGHNPLSRTVESHEVTEVGVLMTTESSKVLGFIGSADNITMDMAATYPAYVKYGYALGNGYNRFFNTEEDDLHLFSAVMYNIPLSKKNVQTNIVCRPFYKVGDTYIYGETLKATLYDVAVEVAASEQFKDYDDEMKAYINEIIAWVDTGTDIEEDEIIINIGGLYPGN